MITTKSMSALVASTMLCGCAVPLRPAQRDRPVDVPVEAQCTFTATYPEKHNCCAMKPYTVRLDVNTSFARAVREYDFSERVRPWEAEADAYPVTYKGHQYVVEPGSRYQLKGVVVPESDVRLFRGLWIGLDLTKSSPNSTVVSPVYCEALGRSMEDQQAWHKAVQQSIRRTLPEAKAFEE